MKQTDIMRKLALVGQCYKTDLAIVMNNDNGNESKQLERMKQKGYLIERDIIKSKRKGETIKAVAITSLGRATLCNKEGTSYYEDIEPYINLRFSTSDTDRLNRRLEDSRIALTLDNVKIRAFEKDKPTLATLCQKQSQAVSPLTYEEFYDNSLSRSEVLQNGVYYTAQELRNYIRDISSKDEADSFLGFRGRGIFINQEQVCVLYLPHTFSKSTLNITVATEVRALKIIKKYICPINNAHDINAMVLTNANALIVDMGIAGKNGKNPRTELPEIVSKRKLDKNLSLYDHIYVFPHTKSGMDSLDYFAHHTLKQWQDDSRTLYRNLEGFDVIPKENIANETLIGQDVNAGVRCVFLPFYDIKYLDFLHKFYEEVSILSYEDMFDILSHIIRRENLYYDLDGNQYLVNRYQENGLLEGEEYSETVRTRKKSFKQISVKVLPDETTKLKQIAKMRNESVSAYVRELIRAHIDEDYKQYEQYVELEKQNKRLIQSKFKPKNSKSRVRGIDNMRIVKKEEHKTKPKQTREVEIIEDNDIVENEIDMMELDDLSWVSDIEE